MVTFQFFTSCLLIIGTLTVINQINFMRNENLGFDEEQIVAVGLVDRQDQTNNRVLKEAILAESSVNSVALSSTLPGRDGFYAFQIEPEGSSDDDEMTMKSLAVDAYRT